MSTDLDSRRGRMHLAFAAQRAAVLADPVPSLELRLDRVDRVRRLVVEGEDRIRVAMTDDFGSLHPAMVVMLDTLPVIEQVTTDDGATVTRWPSIRSARPATTIGVPTARPGPSITTRSLW